MFRFFPSLTPQTNYTSIIIRIKFVIRRTSYPNQWNTKKNEGSKYFISRKLKIH